MIILIFYMSFLIIRNIQLFGRLQLKQQAYPYQKPNHPVEKYIKCTKYWTCFDQLY